MFRRPRQSKLLPTIHSNVDKRPFKGAKSTVAAVQDYIISSQNSYVIRDLAEQITEGLPSKDYTSEPLAICYWVATHTRYVRDPRTVELVKSPELIVKQLYSGRRPSLDCDDMAALIGSLCAALGYRVRLVVVAFRNIIYRGERQYSHIFLQAQHPMTKVWMTLDPVAGHDMKGMLKKGKFWRVYGVN